MKKHSPTRKEVREINDRYARDIDKYYRMCAGVTTCLLGVRNTVGYMAVFVSYKWGKDPLTTAVQMAKSLLAYCPDLGIIKAWDVKIYEATAVEGTWLIEPREEDNRNVLSVHPDLSLIAHHKISMPYCNSNQKTH